MLPLKHEIIYGPVNSRRLGRSLGINLLPARGKVCSFDCIYCQYGRTPGKTLDPKPEGFPPFNEVIAAVETALISGPEFDNFTFSGNGEPTMHPRFPQVVARVLEVRNALAPGARVCAMSNGLAAWRPAIPAAA